MRKENRHPNQTFLGDPKKQGGKAMRNQSFKPKFIVKDTSTISCQ